MSDLIKEFAKGVWASLDVKAILLSFYYKSLKPQLIILVAKTDNPWDDYAVTALDFLLEKFFGDSAKADALKKDLA